ncbi:cyclodeaminase [Trinickia caryophylli]|uniref:Ornithine cyclodeaminase n=1 Tax=Trinickia caryophylli TaxID=28094 RepID=A0A1X7CYZ5_TRICW|nr:cyclodeaminase [Trinickia caryophylli]PMS13505.1 cyclodeaminase [Trinickia caryophylli]TRX13637.1 cyclodeaminase [Trinickia caryophylli]WQE15218.1 cyclodeaminase [Trinickia caryophylli]SMF05612.1 ornithine cyclodeaminase [Trinickia caryophylli]GLU31041.1 cyclodeaminase [Trinickia caryophylli]
MKPVVLVGEATLRELVPLDLAAVDRVEGAFAALATQAVVMPPILRLDLPEHRGEVDVKTAYLPHLDSFAIKVSPGFFDNPSIGLPSLNGLMLVLSAKTGLTEAVLLDNGYLTAVRTAAAGAVAARWLARPDARHVALLGAGEQARLQLRALMLVREIATVTIWARRREAAQALAAELAELPDTCGLRCEVSPDVPGALAQADVAITTTPSCEPLVQASALHPGLHITAMGSDAEHKNEIAPAALAAARYVCDRLAQTRVLGELHHAIAAGAVPRDAAFAELGQVIAAQVPGRTGASDVTICDLTGTGAQDTAIAALALERVRAQGAGLAFRNE